MHKSILISILFFGLSNLVAQGESTTKNEICLNVFKLEVVPESINDIYMFKWTNGLVYKRILGKRFRAFTGLEYSARKIKDRKPSYTYVYEGNGKLKELRVNLGLSYHFAGQALFTPYLEVGGYSAWSTYQGEFISNENQRQVKVDNSFVRIGGILKAGLSYRLNPNFMINGAAGIRVELPSINEMSKTDFNTNTANRILTWIPFEITLSYFF